jgi:hypothetical protein
VRARSRALGFFEQPDYEQQNHRTDDSVYDLCDDAADENESGQWQEPTGQDGADNADDDVSRDSKAVAPDERPASQPATPPMTSQIMMLISMTLPPGYADTRQRFLCR